MRAAPLYPVVPDGFTLYVGLPTPSGRLPVELWNRGHDHALVSAGALWRGGHFQVPGSRRYKVLPDRKACTLGSVLDELSVALDSAGFTAMRNRGGYPWTCRQYVELAASYSWCMWFQMDLCCEPEIASDRVEVLQRVVGTSQLLAVCTELARRSRFEGDVLLTDPIPVLQGWEPWDYERSAEGAAETLGELPSVVGVGSVCRRSEGGPAGLWAILRRLDDVLPRRVRLHLFGVKGQALRRLREHPRVASADSQAWGSEAMHAANRDRKALMEATGCSKEEAVAAVPCDLDRKLSVLDEWLASQQAPSKGQARLPFL